MALCPQGCDLPFSMAQTPWLKAQSQISAIPIGIALGFISEVSSNEDWTSFESCARICSPWDAKASLKQVKKDSCEQERVALLGKAFANSALLDS